MATIRKSRLMKEVEEARGQPIEEILPLLVTERGLTGAADELGISKATCGYWLLKFGLRVVHVVLRANETVEIKTVTMSPYLRNRQ